MWKEFLCCVERFFKPPADDATVEQAHKGGIPIQAWLVQNHVIDGVEVQIPVRVDCRNRMRCDKTDKDLRGRAEELDGLVLGCGAQSGWHEEPLRGDSEFLNPLSGQHREHP